MNETHSRPSIEDRVAAASQVLDNDKRRQPRYPIYVEGQIQSQDGEPAVCVIHDFSGKGLGVSVPRGALTDSTAQQSFQPGNTVSLRFPLPGDGRRVRANSHVKHAEFKDYQVRIGVCFDQCNPQVLDALLKHVDRAERPSQATEVASAPLTPELIAAVNLEPQSLPVSAICDRFFSMAQDRLFAECDRNEHDPSAYFYGSVALRGYEMQLRELLEQREYESDDALRKRFWRLLRQLDVSEEVRDLLVTTFDDAVAAADE